ncbi:hypothetical protein K466DRAFT_135153 [Polyporus arcularius HHB13444]|uniref:Uncharacterized protein n=1 Tax=Polyporus arcularius HHB13444 TaxID=1314778 RepID=A0A5C3PC37_9APHY|nr:hypothetical protein K466DRAFT_135153 [Polyporus arcularius HHB13444]
MMPPMGWSDADAEKLREHASTVFRRARRPVSADWAGVYLRSHMSAALITPLLDPTASYTRRVQKFSRVFLRDRLAEADTPVPGRQRPNGRLAISAWIVPWSPCCVSRAQLRPARLAVHVACTTQRWCRSSDCVCRAPSNSPHRGDQGRTLMTNPSMLFVPFVAHAHHRRHPTTLWTPDAKGNPSMPTSIFQGSPLSIRPARSRPNRLSCPHRGRCAAIPPGSGT